MNNILYISKDVLCKDYLPLYGHPKNIVTPNIDELASKGTVFMRHYTGAAFYTQAHRKLAIVGEKYKYIYNKETDTEELYDLSYDPHEDFSLMEDYGYDADRHKRYSLREVYYYPDWNEAAEVRNVFRKLKDEIWREATFRDRVQQKLRHYADRLGMKK